MRTWAWLLILPLIGLFGQLPIGPVMQMALSAIAIFLVVKTQTLMAYRTCGKHLRVSYIFAWFLTWPGLNPDKFFTPIAQLPSPKFRDWILAISKTTFGLAMLFIFAPQLVAWNNMAAGWVAMVGILFVFHFGLFHILALTWRQAGHDVSPIMNSPLYSTSLAEFWNRRWNVAFRDFAYVHVFQPLAKQYGATIATWGGFVFSGFIHELAISVPTHTGYGLPMSYFLLQGVGIAAERRAFRQGWWNRNSIYSWLFVVLLTVPAAYFLFHPQFIQCVILPLVQN